MRNKLKGRIIEKYNSQANFCRNAEISQAYISMILNCESNGSYKFWEKMKTLLDIPDSEIEEYKKSYEIK